MTYTELRERIRATGALAGRKRDRQRAVRVLLKELGACRGGIRRAKNATSIHEAWEAATTPGDLNWLLEKCRIKRLHETLDANVRAEIATLRERYRLVNRVVHAAYNRSAYTARSSVTFDQALCRAIRAAFTVYGESRG